MDLRPKRGRSLKWRGSGWLALAMRNMETKAKQDGSGSTSIFFQKIWTSSLRSSCSSSANPDFRKWQRKFTKCIPVEPVPSQELKYTTNFNDQSIHSKNRRKRINASKPRSWISQPIRNKNTIYKLRRILQWTHYLIPNKIEAITSFDFRPFLKLTAMESATFGARRRETGEE